MRERISHLSRAVAVLEHMLGCRTDRARDCPTTGGYIRARVDAALSGEDFADDFLPRLPNREHLAREPRPRAVRPGAVMVGLAAVVYRFAGLGNPLTAPWAAVRGALQLAACR